MSVDPVTADAKTGGNFNRYKYAANNPYRFIDPDGRADLNVFPEKQALFYQAGNAFDRPGTFTMAGHGDAGYIQDQSSSQYVDWNGYRAYNEMRGAGLKSGQPAFVISCRFGMADSSGKSAAQIVADKNGSSVYAADGWVNFDKRGNTTTLTVWSGRGRTGEQGAFQQYAPGGKGPVAGAAISSIAINTKNNTVTLNYGVQLGSRIPRKETYDLDKKGK